MAVVSSIFNGHIMINGSWLHKRSMVAGYTFKFQPFSCPTPTISLQNESQQEFFHWFIAHRNFRLVKNSKSFHRPPVVWLRWPCCTWIHWHSCRGWATVVDIAGVSQTHIRGVVNIHLPFITLLLAVDHRMFNSHANYMVCMVENSSAAIDFTKGPGHCAEKLGQHSSSTMRSILSSTTSHDWVFAIISSSFYHV